MKQNNYDWTLKQAPRHEEPKFIDFLRDKNKVVMETKFWLLIENIKYHTTQNPHYTLFPKHYAHEWADLNTYEIKEFKKIMNRYEDWFKYENSKKSKTIDRFHIHLVKNQLTWLKMMYKIEINHEVRIKYKKTKELMTFKGKFKKWLKSNNVKIVTHEN